MDKKCSRRKFPGNPSCIFKQWSSTASACHSGLSGLYLPCSLGLILQLHRSSVTQHCKTPRIVRNRIIATISCWTVTNKTSRVTRQVPQRCVPNRSPWFHHPDVITPNEVTHTWESHKKGGQGGWLQPHRTQLGRERQPASLSMNPPNTTLCDRGYSKGRRSWERRGLVLRVGPRP